MKFVSMLISPSYTAVISGPHACMHACGSAQRTPAPADRKNIRVLTLLINWPPSVIKTFSNFPCNKGIHRQRQQQQEQHIERRVESSSLLVTICRLSGCGCLQTAFSSLSSSSPYKLLLFGVPHSLTHSLTHSVILKSSHALRG